MIKLQAKIVFPSETERTIASFHNKHSICNFLFPAHKLPSEKEWALKGNNLIPRGTQSCLVE